jgi:hypothetical protein
VTPAFPLGAADGVASMTMTRGAAAVAGFAVLTWAGCSPNEPSPSISGGWSARGAGHSSLFWMVLEQRGTSIGGVACASDGPLLFEGAPVHGTYPRVSFVVTPQSTQPCCPGVAGAAFSGRFDDTGDIVGRLSTGVDLRFERGTRGATCTGPTAP